MWTKDKPNKPGWYWWRWNAGGSGGYPRIVRVVDTDRYESPLAVVYSGSEKLEPLNNVSGEFWSEPILPPSDGPSSQ